MAPCWKAFAPHSLPVQQVVHVCRSRISPADNQHVQQGGLGKGRAMPSGWSSMSISLVRPCHGLLLRRLPERLGHNADVGDPGLFDRVHDRSERAKGNPLVGPQIDDLAGWIGLRLV
jgi:hypothetical protein